MPSTAPFAAVDQGDVAFIETGGIAYRCFVWQRNSQYVEGENDVYRGAAIEAAIYTEGPHGQRVLLHRGIVRTPAAGENVDCPRVVARGTVFHVHWIEYDPVEIDGEDPPSPSGHDLHRSTFDVTANAYAWTHRGSIPIHHFHLYDTHTMDTSEDYVLAYGVSTTQIGVYRVNGNTWVDAAWTASVGSIVLDQNVLCVIADRSSVGVLYQSSGALEGFSRLWDTGNADVAPTTTVASPGGDIVAITGTRRADGRDGDVFVLFEAQDSTSASQRLPFVTSFDMRTTAMVAGTVTRTRNVTLESKVWKYASQRSAVVFTETPMFFACLGYIGRNASTEWLQTCHYVARWEYDTAFAGRPIPVATLSYGIAHSAMHGDFPVVPAGGGGGASSTGPDNTKRRNHLPSATPAPSFGPLQHSYTTFLPKWTRLDSVTAVAGAELRSTTFHHDDPWAYPYDDTNGALPTTPYASVSVPHLEPAPAGDGLFLGGGTPQVYDGHQFVECGFPWRPEILNAEESSTGSLTSGTYVYVVVAEWRDNRGQTHRAVSDPVTVVTSSGRGVDIEIRCINLSMKDNAALGIETSPPVKLDVYRTRRGPGTVFFPLYRGNSDTAFDMVDCPVNDPTAFAVTLTDVQSDATIAANIPLPYSYTSGVWTPVLPEKPPAMTAVASWQNRVWGVAAEDPSSLWYSQELLPEFGGERYSVPEFSPDLRFRVDGIGRIVAMHEMDSALVLFTVDAIYALHGLPADATGAGASLQLQTLQKGTGCVEPRSVASAPDGLYFQSRRGFYHLSRQNALTYVGADVEDELRAAGNVRAVTVHEENHQVRLLCSGAPYDSPQVLVYDWLMKLWAVWPLPSANPNNGRSSAVDAVDWRGHIGEHAHTVALTSGVLVQKPSSSASLYADESAGNATVAIPVDVRTGWIHLAGLAGYKRVREVVLHMTKPAGAPLTVELEYDLDGSQADGANIQTETIASPAAEYIPIRTAIQKCRAIRIRIYEGTATPTGTQLTESTLNLHALTLVVGVKPGTARVSPTSQRT